MADGSITILVSEGNLVVRKGLVTLLELMVGLRVVAVAGDGFETIAQFHRSNPAVTQIDLQLPQFSAVEVADCDPVGVLSEHQGV